MFGILVFFDDVVIVVYGCKVCLIQFKINCENSLVRWSSCLRDFYMVNDFVEIVF